MDSKLDIDFLNCTEDECIKVENIIKNERYNEPDIKTLFDKYN